MTKLVTRLFFVIMLLSGLVGCSVYSANSGRVDESIQRVAVEYFENLTAEPDLGVDLSDAITSAIQLDNTLKVVEEGDADIILNGKVMRYALKELAARQDLTVT